MSQFPVPTRASTPAVVAACAASLLLHAGLGYGLATYRVPAPAGASDMDLGVEILLPAQGTGLPSPNETPAPPPDSAAKVNLAEAIPTPPPPQIALAPQQAPEPEPPKPPEEEVVRLGTDDGVGVSENMLGAAQASPHSATPGSVDQPALTLAPGAPGLPGAGDAQQSSDAREAGDGGAGGTTGTTQQDQDSAPPSPAPEQTSQASPPSEQAPEPSAQPPAEVPAPAMPVQPSTEQSTNEAPPTDAIPAPAITEPAVVPRVAPSTSTTSQPESLVQEPAIFESEDAPSTDNIFNLSQPQQVTVIDELGTEAAKEAAKPVVEQPAAPAVVPAQPEPPAPETPTPTAPDPLTEEAKISLTPVLAQPSPLAPAMSSPAPGAVGSPATTGGDSRLPGVTSDAESTAVSTSQTLDFKPGMPLTGKGIRIRTVVPRFSTTTQLTTMPRNPVLVIRFNRAGRVVKAEFEKNEGTGYRDVDEPLLDAVYRWTAVGEQLSKLPADGKETIAFRIRYLLRDE